MQGLAKQSRHIMYTEAHLVSFGNYLLKTYGVKVHSTDGYNRAIGQREVSHADTENWKQETMVEKMPALPFRFQYGDQVAVYFGESGIIRNCKVIKIHLNDSHVSYDVEVKYKHSQSAEKISAGLDTERIITGRLYNLDSENVLSPDQITNL